jgi:hypothetical protein
MIAQPHYARTLFVFNDNEAQFDALQRGEPEGCLAGAGNAAIRPHQCGAPRRAAGIPTGTGGERPTPGYKDLQTCRPKLDEALAVIERLLATGDYDRLVFSRSKDGPWLGSRIFEPAHEVLVYVHDQLIAMG